ncbi:inositol monophosphatase family protein, partial [Klebsiella pneumoniae]|uniref:inositol monophosphatase family protein n=1 Tax=Klebsiella pneumoniae TaxID=573 RepID=UPI0024115681
MQSQESEALQARYRLACELAKAGAELAFEYYQQREALTVDHKGDDLQDVVSVADKRVETFVKQRIQSAFPEDGFLGEESGARLPDARVLWVVDPIDGTSCFLNGLHTWCLYDVPGNIYKRGEEIASVPLQQVGPGHFVARESA